MTPQRIAGGILAVLGLVFIASMTLTPQPGPSSYAPSLCVFCGDMAVQDIILNVILFVPFATGLRLLGLSRWRVVSIAMAATISIETLQMHVIAGRDASLGDVISNTLGGIVGVGLADTWRLWLTPTPRAARRLVWGASIALCAMFAATVWGMRRTLPDTTLWGQWVPELLHFDPFPGAIVAARAAGVPFPPGALGSDAAFRRRLVSDSMVVQATVVPGGATARMAPILELYDWQQTQIFLLGQRGRSLMFSVRMNAARSAVRDPMIALHDVFPAVGTSDTLHVAAGVVERALVVSARAGNGPVRERRVPLSPGLGWSFLLPWNYGFDGATAFLSMLWLGGLIAPVAYWAARARRPAEMTLAAAVVLLALRIVPAVLGGAPATGWEWGSIAVGAAAGLAIAALGRGGSGNERMVRAGASRVRAA